MITNEHFPLNNMTTRSYVPLYVRAGIAMMYFHFYHLSYRLTMALSKYLGNWAKAGRF